MKKETSIAVVLGVLFGTILALFLIFQNRQKQMENNKSITTTKKNSPTIAINNNISQSIIIDKPQDNLIVDTNKVTIEGKAPVGGLIVIQSPTKDLISKNEKENIKIDVPLSLGENIINITFYPKDKQLKSQKKILTVYYLENQL